MSYTSCPTVVINTSVDVVWGLLTQPSGWASVFDLRVHSVSPPGPATAGQKIKAEAGPQFFRLNLMFRIVELDAIHHRLWLDAELPFGITAFEDLRCASIDADACRVDYRCGFEFPTGWRGSLLRMLLKRELNVGPIVSPSRLKRAAEQACESAAERQKSKLDQAIVQYRRTAT